MRICASYLLLALSAAILLPACTQSTPQQKILSAKKLILKNDPESASIELKNALALDPNLAEARFLLGSVFLDNGNFADAYAELRKALAANYPREIIIPELARAMLQLGQIKQLTEEFSSARFDVPAATASLQTTLSIAHTRLGNPELATSALDLALQADPSYAPALLALAWRKVADRDHDGALKVVDTVTSRQSASADAWKTKGDILLIAKDDFDGALSAYRRSIEIKPKFLVGHLALISTMLRQGKLDDASKQLPQLKAFAPNNLQTKYLEAQLAYRKSDPKLARENVQQILRYSPDRPSILQLAGAIELQSNDIPTAVRYLSRAMQIDPKLASARRLLILAYLRSGQAENAIAVLRAAADHGELEPGLYWLAGQAYMQNGDPRKAEEHFEKARRLKPDDPRPRTSLAIARLGSSQSEAAFEELQAISASESDTAADLAIISARWQRREFGKALEAIDRYQAKHAGDPTPVYLRGRVQLASGDSRAAKESFEQALSIDPFHFAATAGLAMIDISDKRPEDAKHRLAGLVAKDAKNVQALTLLAGLMFATGAPTVEVVDIYQRAIQADPNLPEPRLKLIDLYVRTHNIKEALRVAQAADSAIPNRPEILDALGRTQQAFGDLNQALLTFSRLASAQPRAPLPHIRLAGVHLASKNKAAAEQSLRKALEVTPDQIDAQRGLIGLALESKRYKEAELIAGEIQKRRPTEGYGFSLEGDIRALQKDWKGAERAYRSALQRRPTSDVAIRLHAVLVDSKDNQQSEKFSIAWTTAHPSDWAFFSYLGALAISRNDYHAALGAYQKAITGRPNDASALNNLAWVTHHLRKDGALGYAERANKAAPDHPAFMDTLAMILADRREFSKAIELQNRALVLQPANAALRLNLAKLFIASGDTQRARDNLNVLSKLGGKFPAQAEVKALLTAL